MKLLSVSILGALTGPCNACASAPVPAVAPARLLSRFTIAQAETIGHLLNVMFETLVEKTLVRAPGLRTQRRELAKEG